MRKVVAFAALGLANLLFVGGSAEAGCGSGGWWGYSPAPAYQPYYYYPAPGRTAARGYSYRSYSYEPGAAQPTYRYYAPRYDSGSSSYNQFRADRKMRGLVN